MRNSIEPTKKPSMKTEEIIVPCDETQHLNIISTKLKSKKKQENHVRKIEKNQVICQHNKEIQPMRIIKDHMTPFQHNNRPQVPNFRANGCTTLYYEVKSPSINQYHSTNLKPPCEQSPKNLVLGRPLRREKTLEKIHYR